MSENVASFATGLASLQLLLFEKPSLLDHIPMNNRFTLIFLFIELKNWVHLLYKATVSP